MVRHLQRKLVYTVATLILGVWSLFLINRDRHRAPVHQRLLLTLDMPSIKNHRYFILKEYFPLLQSQLEQQEYQEDETVYVQRKEYANNYCMKRQDIKPVESSYIRNLTWYLEHPGMLYCPELKAGTTFWRRAFEVLRRKSPHTFSPYQLSFGDFMESNAKIPSHYTEPDHREDITNLLQSAVKFVFVRDPYSRIFSTYVDKVLSPNAYFWDFGKEAIRKFRNSSQSESCGSDVTFEEFIKNVNSNDPGDLDNHIRPVSSKCDICEIDYDVIGKMETFQTDARYILKKVGSYGRHILFKDMGTEYMVDYIVDTVVRAFELNKKWDSCISVHAACQRLWRQLQIGGALDIKDRYPLTPQQSNKITVTQYLNITFSAFTRSSSAAKGNKRKAFLQAYSTVSLKDLEDLREHYTTDFEMYDYEQRPAELFEVRKKHRKEDFNYFDVMKLK